MITNIKIGAGNQLGAQMLDIASLYYISRENDQKLVFFEELRNFRRGYQFYDAFKMEGINLKAITPFLKDQKSKNWKDEMKRIYFSGMKHRKDMFLYNLFAQNDGFVTINNLKSDINTDTSLLHLDKNKNYDIRCGFGGYKDFQKYIDEILDIFTFKDSIINNIQKKNSEVLDIISSKNTVSVHFRRTDYLLISSLNLSEQYYRKAISQFNDDCFFVVFSDDIEDVKKMNMFDDKKCYFVDGNGPVEDMYLMSKCNHNIIANSSFSLWASLLNRNKSKKVVCPYNFVGTASYLNGNYYPQEYIALKE